MVLNICLKFLDFLGKRLDITIKARDDESQGIEIEVGITPSVTSKLWGNQISNQAKRS